jgi:hypothetical protein
MTPREFLETVLRPNVEDFHTHFADVRHAHNAISTTDALAAHLYFWAKTNAPAAVASSRNDSAYREELAKRNNDFRLLRDIAKAQKHVRLLQGCPLISDAAKVRSRSIGYGEGGYGQGRYGGVEQVVVDTDANSFSFVESIVDSALLFLEGEMLSLGA